LGELVARLIEKRGRRTHTKQQIAEKLALARQNAEQYAALADNPRMSPAAALAARNLARSYKAARMVYEKALAYRKDQENRARLAELVEVAGPPLVPGNR
jgi:hypothetical protein